MYVISYAVKDAKGNAWVVAYLDEPSVALTSTQISALYLNIIVTIQGPNKKVLVPRPMPKA